MASVAIDTGSIADYELFLKIKQLPRYRIGGGFAEYPDEYAAMLGLAPPVGVAETYKPSKFLFDYQRDITAKAIKKRKYAVFADCGLGKTLILLEFAKHVAKTYPGRRVLIVSPLMVVAQTVAEAEKFYGKKLPITRIRANELGEWLRTGSGVGITNYDAITD